ncbi:TNF receptor-associated factor 6-like isoform X2 [Amblyomma americanum]
MPPGSMEYTLVGFSSQLDWIPLCFVKPLPPHRVCDASGLVRKWTALLPCRHTLCESWYELCLRDSGRVCPLDGHRCEDEDVFMKEFPADKLLSREVQCRNVGSGCMAVLPAWQLNQHLPKREEGKMFGKRVLYHAVTLLHIKCVLQGNC